MAYRKLFATLAVGALALAGCSDPAKTDAENTPASGDDTITVGSAAFPESEIIAELYAQALEQRGYQVERKMQIGSREVYAKALESGEIDLIAEYSGNLLTFYQPDATATSAEEVIAALGDALPEGTEVLQAADAENKDSLNITSELAASEGIASIADLAKLAAVKVAANPEFAERSYGVPGLQTIYGLTNVTHVPIDDAGGPATVKALLDGDVNVANIYSTTPAIAENNFVTLTDPENMIAAQQVIPFIRTAAASEEICNILNEVSAALTTDDLIAMNTRSSGDEKAAPGEIAKDWLAEHLPADQ